MSKCLGLSLAQWPCKKPETEVREREGLRSRESGGKRGKERGRERGGRGGREKKRGGGRAEEKEQNECGKYRSKSAKVFRPLSGLLLALSLANII